MRIVNIDQVRGHLKSDPDESQEEISVYADAAEAACERYIDRALFIDDTDRQTQQSAAAGLLAAAFAQYDARKTAAEGNADTRVRDVLLLQIEHDLELAKLQYRRVSTGVIASDDVIAAILLTTGHFYRNREDVTTGQGAAAVEIPNSSRDLLYPLIWMG